LTIYPLPWWERVRERGKEISLKKKKIKKERKGDNFEK